MRQRRRGGERSSQHSYEEDIEEDKEEEIREYLPRSSLVSVLIDDSDDDDDEIPPAKTHSSNEIAVVAPGTYSSRGGNLKTYILYFKLPS